MVSCGRCGKHISVFLWFVLVVCLFHACLRFYRKRSKQMNKELHKVFLKLSFDIQEIFFDDFKLNLILKIEN